MIAGLTPSPNEEEEQPLKNPGPSYSGQIVEESVVPKIKVPFCTEDSQSILEKSITETMSTTYYQTCRSSSHYNDDFVIDLSSSDSTLRSFSCTDINDVNFNDDDDDEEEEAQVTVNESNANSVVCLTDFNFSDSPSCSSDFKYRPQLPLKSFNNRASISCTSSLPSSKNSSTESVDNLNPVLSYLPKNSLEFSHGEDSVETIIKEKQQDNVKQEMSLDLVPKINSIEGNLQVLNPSNSFCNTNNSINIVLESNYLTLTDGLECLNIVEDNSTKDSEIFCCDFFKKIEISEHSNNHLNVDLVRPSVMPCSKDVSESSLPSAMITTCGNDAEELNVGKSSSDSKIESMAKCKNKKALTNCFPL